MVMVDEVIYTNILRVVSITAGILGIIIGLDLIFGARIIHFSKKALDKSIDFDKFIKRILDRTFDFDNVITSPRTKKFLGIVFLVFSIVILLLIRKI